MYTINIDNMKIDNIPEIEGTMCLQGSEIITLNKKSSIDINVNIGNGLYEFCINIELIKNRINIKFYNWNKPLYGILNYSCGNKIHIKDINNISIYIDLTMNSDSEIVINFYNKIKNTKK